MKIKNMAGVAAAAVAAVGAMPYAALAANMPATFNKIDLAIGQLIDGETPATSIAVSGIRASDGLQYVDVGYSCKSLNVAKWLKKATGDTEWTELAEGETFVQGVAYKPTFAAYTYTYYWTYDLTLTANTLVKVDGANEKKNSEWGGVIAVDTLDETYVTAVEPRSEAEISTTATITTKPEGALKVSEVAINWYAGDAEDSIDFTTPLEEGTKFEAGKYYAYGIDTSDLETEEDWDALLNDNFIWADDYKYFYNGVEGTGDYSEAFGPVEFTYRNLDDEKGEFGFVFTEGEVSEEIKTLHIDGDVEEVTGVFIDQTTRLVLGDDYTVENGSVKIAFTEAGINKIAALGAGEHELTVEFGGSEKVSAPISVLPKNPNTIDNFAGYAALVAVAMLGLGVAIAFARKREA